LLVWRPPSLGCSPHNLAPSVVGWRSGDGQSHSCAVPYGVLSVAGGRGVAIATREAVVGEDLAKLNKTVLAGFCAEPHRFSRRREMTAIRGQSLSDEALAAI
jgi:hypothetical protein